MKLALQNAKYKQTIIRKARHLPITDQLKQAVKMFIQLSMNVGRNGGLKTPSPLGNPDVMTQALTL